MACLLLPPPGMSYFLWSVVLTLLMQINLVILSYTLPYPFVFFTISLGGTLRIGEGREG